MFKFLKNIKLHGTYYTAGDEADLQEDETVKGLIADGALERIESEVSEKVAEPEEVKPKKAKPKKAKKK